MDYNDDLYALDPENFKIYNLDLCDAVKNYVDAIFLGHLIYRFRLHKRNGDLISHETFGEGWFYQTEDQVWQFTRMSHRNQQTAIKHLIKLDLIEMQVFGMPAKRHFRIKKDNINKLMNKVVNIKNKSTRKAGPAQPVRPVRPEHSYNTRSSKKETLLSDLAVGLEKFLLDKILLRNDNFKKPKPGTWAKHIDLMINQDKRDPEMIKKIIEWSQSDKFWKNNVLSGEKLRLQFDQLMMRMEADKPPDKYPRDPDKMKEFICRMDIPTCSEVETNAAGIYFQDKEGQSPKYISINWDDKKFDAKFDEALRAFRVEILQENRIWYRNYVKQFMEDPAFRNYGKHFLLADKAGINTSKGPLKLRFLWDSPSFKSDITELLKQNGFSERGGTKHDESRGTEGDKNKETG